MKPRFIVTESYQSAMEMKIWYNCSVVGYDGYYFIAINKEAEEFVKENVELSWNGSN